MKINLHIDRLVLESASPDDSHARLLGQALQTELTRLLAERTTPARLLSSNAVPVLRGEVARQSLPGGPAERGTQLAQAIHGVMRR